MDNPATAPKYLHGVHQAIKWFVGSGPTPPNPPSATRLAAMHCLLLRVEAATTFERSRAKDPFCDLWVGGLSYLPPVIAPTSVEDMGAIVWEESMRTADTIQPDGTTRCIKPRLAVFEDALSVLGAAADTAAFLATARRLDFNHFLWSLTIQYFGHSGPSLKWFASRFLRDAHAAPPAVTVPLLLAMLPHMDAERALWGPCVRGLDYSRRRALVLAAAHLVLRVYGPEEEAEAEADRVAARLLWPVLVHMLVTVTGASGSFSHPFADPADCEPCLNAGRLLLSIEAEVVQVSSGWSGWSVWYGCLTGVVMQLLHLGGCTQEACAACAVRARCVRCLGIFTASSRSLRPATGLALRCLAGLRVLRVPRTVTVTTPTTTRCPF